MDPYNRTHETGVCIIHILEIREQAAAQPILMQPVRQAERRLDYIDNTVAIRGGRRSINGLVLHK